MLEIHNLVEAKSTAVEASHRLYIGDTNPASQSNLIVIEASGFNDSASTVYWQLFGGVAVPGAGTVALYSIRIPAGQSFYFLPKGGFLIYEGGIWAASSTPATFTAAAASIWALVKLVPVHQLHTAADG